MNRWVEISRLWIRFSGCLSTGGFEGFQVRQNSSSSQVPSTKYLPLSCAFPCRHIRSRQRRCSNRFCSRQEAVSHRTHRVSWGVSPWRSSCRRPWAFSEDSRKRLVFSCRKQSTFSACPLILSWQPEWLLGEKRTRMFLQCEEKVFYYTNSTTTRVMKRDDFQVTSLTKVLINVTKTHSSSPTLTTKIENVYKFVKIGVAREGSIENVYLHLDCIGNNLVGRLRT